MAGNMQAAPQMQRRPSNIQGGDEFWIDVQKKAFTRWANSYLSDRAQVITDLYTDLGDGLRLISLLELLTDAPFPSKYTKEPRFRIHKLENLNMVFGFLAKEHVMVTNIGSSDILDGNGKLILGLMWTIIKRYQVGDIAVDGVSGKEGCVLHCYMKHKRLWQLVQSTAPDKLFAGVTVPVASSFSSKMRRMLASTSEDSLLSVVCCTSSYR
ncbi:hypothetical protein H257_16723 [Aphanomyces astaci]|uniref:Calponin-homology (CH) domain-containing protein n=1 Tax=Aphanomyces astaci TaxID=112090 RepID=W4FHH9_APHAT|nr:hypothetical protein H257_16723 [Aphanomyces astaci]ETV66915.1 hypothetical protein H257_16723 [Aphanomyces astaci]|eukprot:XP_009843556.1 hypothetical protein H257_16723 [Aphanomyces astaci]